MKLKFFLLFILFLITAFIFAGCNVNIAGNNAAEDINDSSLYLRSEPDETVQPESPVIPDDYITAGEARAILQDWVDSHPFQLGAEIEPDEYLPSGEVQGEEYTFEGGEYYRFYLGITRLGVAEILVHKETGNLFHLESPYSSVGFAPIDDWYNKDHAAGTDGLNDDDPAFGLLNSLAPVYYTLVGVYSDDKGWADAYDELGEAADGVFLYIVPYGTGLFGTPGEEYGFVWWDKDEFNMNGEISPYSLENNGNILTVWNFYFFAGLKFQKKDEIPDSVPALYKEVNLQSGNPGYLWADFPAVFGGWDNLMQDDYGDFSGYLLEVVPEAQEYINMGMSALVTGETVEAGGFPACMTVELGMNHADQFVREKHYAITPDGGVLQLDWLTGGWEYIFGGEYYEEGPEGAPDILDMSDAQLKNYLIGNAPEISERMNMRGGENLRLIVLENIREDIPGESRCREIRLVSDGGGDAYDIVIIYAVGGSGAIYEDTLNGWVEVDPSYHPYPEFDEAGGDPPTAESAPSGGLAFTKQASFDIPENTRYTAIKSINVSDGVSGGATPYTFSKVSGPDWLKVNAAGILSGSRQGVADATTAVIQVKDADGATATITINIGEVK